MCAGCFPGQKYRANKAGSWAGAPGQLARLHATYRNWLLWFRTSLQKRLQILVRVARMLQTISGWDFLRSPCANSLSEIVTANAGEAGSRVFLIRTATNTCRNKFVNRIQTVDEDFKEKGVPTCPVFCLISH